MGGPPRIHSSGPPQHAIGLQNQQNYMPDTHTSSRPKRKLATMSPTGATTSSSDPSGFRLVLAPPDWQFVIRRYTLRRVLVRKGMVSNEEVLEEVKVVRQQLEGKRGR